MKKIVLPDPKNMIHTLKLDYMQTPPGPIWGNGNPNMYLLIEQQIKGGVWLNLACGDGRYNTALLERADRVIVADLQEDAMQKLYRDTPKMLRKKLERVTLNLLNPLPFADGSIDGVFCTGTLHYFPEEVISKIFKEIRRVTHSNGRLIIDFPTEVKRIQPNGQLFIRETEGQYEFDQAKQMLTRVLHNYHTNLIEYKIHCHHIIEDDREYDFYANFILVYARKKDFEQEALFRLRPFWFFRGF